MKVFISYTRKDPDKRSQIFGKKLAKFLSAREIDVIFDEISFKHSKSIAGEMIDGIYKSDKFVFLASPSALKSKYVMAELDWARDRAIKVKPRTFFHVVIVADDFSVSDLPSDLASYLCHQTHGKSELKLLYEIFLSLNGIIFGDLAKKMLAHNPDSTWIIPELYRKIRIDNVRGDATISTLRTMLNIGEITEHETRYMYLWAEDGAFSNNINLRAYNQDGKGLKIDSEIVQYRGHESLKYKILFDDKVDPEEVVSFWTTYNWESKFDLVEGSKYPLSSEDMIYGYLRLDIVFPRNLVVDVPIVEISHKTGQSSMKLSEIGSNMFSFSTFETKIGYIYSFHLKCLTPQST